MKLKSSHSCHGGIVNYYSHAASSTRCDMNFSIFLPEQARNGNCPALYYLAGLTCTEDNFTTKSGAYRLAAELGLIMIAPDTSPRGDHVPDEEGWDFAQGAGFYVDATEKPWNENYNMYSYITEELYELILEKFPLDNDRIGIFGHSMGGHGALTIALRNPAIFKSVSAFSPIVAPSQVPWGEKAFAGYLGPDQSVWREHDACALVQSVGWQRDILVDQGAADQFLKEQLRPELLEQACTAAGVPLTLRRHETYDHSYYFIASFVGYHIRWHAERLAA